MSDAAAWLREHVGDAPEPLLALMLRSLPEGTSVPDALAEGALRLYAEVAAGTGGRDDALPLLAADALFTHAFQAQAEIDPAGILSLAERCGARGRLREVAG